MAGIVYKERNPFTPDEPVSKERFRGREKEINQLMQLANQVALGGRQYVFITGDYGIGKSSLASYIRYAVQKEFGLIAFHIYLSEVDTIEDMVFNIINGILQQTKEADKLDKIIDFFSRYISSVSLFGVTINSEALREDIKQYSGSFISLLQLVYEKLSDDYKGIVLILDDLNGISRNPKFAPMLKSTVDSNATSPNPIPLMLVLSGVEQRRQDMIEVHPSVARIFNVVQIEPMKDKETEEFFVAAFNSIEWDIEKEALDILIMYSSGLPRLIHEIGNGVFWASDKDKITTNSAFLGIRYAIESVGTKYFGPLQTILKTDEYKSILKTLLSSEKPLNNLKFQKIEIRDKLKETEKERFDNFLQRMKKLKAIHPGDIKGTWVFADRITYWYFYFETERLLGKIKHK